jgi:protein O-mannosyl-transferase
MTAPSPPRWVGGALAAGVLLVFAGTADFAFLNFDDNEYITDNPMVRRGLTWRSFWWAATHAHAANWHPLTWWSHMADVSLWGLAPGGHHLTSVVLHACVAVGLLLALARLTGQWQRSAVVAALFAVHPLRVESVAWVAERKDVLCGLGWVASLWTYSWYCEQPSRGRGMSVCGALGFALLAKPMAVTLPFVLLLLDYWPLARTDWRARVREKLPLFALAAAVAVATFVVQRSAGAMATVAGLPIGFRLANAAVSSATYVQKLVWPWPMAVFFPLRPLAPAEIVAGVVVLVVISAVALWTLRRAPYVAVGWAWFLGTLVPVIGLIKVGDQAMADRFTYLPHIGLLLAAVWAVADVLAASRARWIAPLLAGVAVGGSAIATYQYLPVWRDSETLFTHALAVTTNNHIAEINLGAALQVRGEREAAIGHFRSAIRFAPHVPKAHISLGAALAEGGDHAGAVAAYEEALRLDPRSALAYFDLGTAQFRQGRFEVAQTALERALALDPLYARAQHQLGDVFARTQRWEAAITAYRRALAIAPDLLASRVNLGIALESSGQRDAAIAEYRQAVQIEPDNASVHANLGAALAEAGKPREAATAFREALRLRPGWQQIEEALRALPLTEAEPAMRP